MIKIWRIALPAVFLMTAFISLAQPKIASAAPTTQDLTFAYSAADQKLTLSTLSFDASLIPAIVVPNLKVDGNIFTGPDDCTILLDGVTRQCVFSGVDAKQSIAAVVELSDSAGGILFQGKTRFHCNVPNCTGVKSVNMR